MAEAHPARRGMNHHLINPKYQATIRSPPEIEVKAHAFTVQTTPTISTEGFLYWTPRNGDAPYKPNKRGLLPAEDQGTGKRGLGHLNDLPVQPRFIFTHGRGRKIDNLGFINFVSGIARTFPVLVWNGVEDINDRVQTYNYLYNDGQQTYVGIGGRSTGGRASVRTSAFSRNKKLVLWSYPLVRNSEVRSPELLALSADTRVLFIRGANDYMSSEPIFNSVRSKMRAKSWHIRVTGLDHNFTCVGDLVKEATLTSALGQIAALWLEGDNHDENNPYKLWDEKDGTELIMDYDIKTDPAKPRAVWGDWKPFVAEKEEALIKFST